MTNLTLSYNLWVVPSVCADVICGQPTGGTAVVKATACWMQQCLNIVSGCIVQRPSTETVCRCQTGVISQQIFHYLKFWKTRMW